MGEWFEDEEFWECFYPFLFPPERFTAAKDEVNKIVNLTAFRGNRILDLACGPGRHSVAFALKGYSVTAVDRSKYLLEKAKSYSVKTSANVEWVEQDIRDFVRPETFELAVSLFTSFGYFEKKEEDELVLRNICQSIKPGGFFFIDMVGKERLARIYQSTILHELSSGQFVIERPKVVEEWSRIRNEWIFVQGSTARKFCIHHNIYSGQELKSLLLRVGFSHVRLLGDFDGNEYGVDAARLIAIASKDNVIYRLPGLVDA